MIKLEEESLNLYYLRAGEFSSDYIDVTLPTKDNIKVVDKFLSDLMEFNYSDKCDQKLDKADAINLIYKALKVELTTFFAVLMRKLWVRPDAYRFDANSVRTEIYEAMIQRSNRLAEIACSWKSGWSALEEVEFTINYKRDDEDEDKLYEAGLMFKGQSLKNWYLDLDATTKCLVTSIKHFLNECWDELKEKGWKGDQKQLLRLFNEAVHHATSPRLSEVMEIVYNERRDSLEFYIERPDLVHFRFCCSINNGGRFCHLCSPQMNLNHGLRSGKVIEKLETFCHQVLGESEDRNLEVETIFMGVVDAMRKTGRTELVRYADDAETFLKTGKVPEPEPIKLPRELGEVLSTQIVHTEDNCYISTSLEKFGTMSSSLITPSTSIFEIDELIYDHSKSVYHAITGLGMTYGLDDVYRYLLKFAEESDSSFLSEAAKTCLTVRTYLNNTCSPNKIDLHAEVTLHNMTIEGKLTLMLGEIPADVMATRLMKAFRDHFHSIPYENFVLLRTSAYRTLMNSSITKLVDIGRSLKDLVHKEDHEISVKKGVSLENSDTEELDTKKLDSVPDSLKESVGFDVALKNSEPVLICDLYVETPFSVESKAVDLNNAGSVIEEFITEIQSSLRRFGRVFEKDSIRELMARTYETDKDTDAEDIFGENLVKLVNFIRNPKNLEPENTNLTFSANVDSDGNKRLVCDIDFEDHFCTIQTHPVTPKNASDRIKSFISDIYNELYSSRTEHPTYDQILEQFLESCDGDSIKSVFPDINQFIA